jgi:hypothetical protein
MFGKSLYVISTQKSVILNEVWYIPSVYADSKICDIQNLHGQDLAKVKVPRNRPESPRGGIEV